MESESSYSHKFTVIRESLVETHLITMKFLLDKFGPEGDQALKDYYAKKHDMMFSAKVGTKKKAASKVVQKISSRKFLEIFADQMIKNVENMIPSTHISNIEFQTNEAKISIDNCPLKRVFKRGLRRYKVKDQIPLDYFCTLNCMPSFQRFGELGSFDITGAFKEKGCDIIIKISD